MKKQYEKMMKMMFGEVKITTCELQNLLWVRKSHRPSQ
jgi:hypothetical protein